MSSKPNKNSAARLHPLTEPVLYGFVPVPPLLPHYGRGTTEVSASPAPPPHQVYFEVRGNLAGMPLLLFHGGPGYYCVPEDAQFFDPSVFCVISFDQRGSGKSTPPAHEGCWNAYESLTIDVLVADAELVRGHVMKEIQQMVLKRNAASSKKLTAVAGGKSAASTITTGEETQASSRAAARQLLPVSAVLLGGRGDLPWRCATQRRSPNIPRTLFFRECT
ncbi:proline iminopeptidase, putative [Bodo saltans]|uniref:prolyl aminopeptidase n=1 Tax=Bodo saltans TaxID=75058 RepID=A0A0S4JW46_BODSA|nr:proline iminopeptidase, putative [Bodo saltans]|eukprot:CUG93679.1 proline iminopeptidase, putative [Bodo saltans]